MLLLVVFAVCKNDSDYIVYHTERKQLIRVSNIVARYVSVLCLVSKIKFVVS